MMCAIQSNIYAENKNIKRFFYADPNYEISNAQLYKMYKRVIPIIPFRTLAFQIDKIMNRFNINNCKSDPIKIMFEDSEGGYDRWRFFEKIDQSFISFLPHENKVGDNLLSKLGISKNAKYVCLLVRDQKYLKVHMPDSGWSYHNYRDADIDNYIKSIELLTQRGYFVVRMGKCVDKPLIINNQKFIDYANHPLRSDFLDIYLTAHCTFFMSTSSGIDSVAQIFRKPILVTNFVLCDLRSYLNWELFTLKRVYDTINKRFLSFKEIMDECNKFTDTHVCIGIDRVGMFQSWRSKGYQLIENTPDEITDAVCEMLELIEKNKFIQDKNYQLEFWNLYDNNRAKHDEGKNSKLRISESYLSRYPELLAI